MRAEQYQRHLDAVTDYIYAHLDDDLSLENLAHVSGFSAYHWHRIYRAVRGETAAQTVRRLRLERAAAMLTETSWPVERIAREADSPAPRSSADPSSAPTGRPQADSAPASSRHRPARR